MFHSDQKTAAAAAAATAKKFNFLAQNMTSMKLSQARKNYTVCKIITKTHTHTQSKTHRPSSLAGQCKQKT